MRTYEISTDPTYKKYLFIPTQYQNPVMTAKKDYVFPKEVIISFHF